MGPKGPKEEIQCKATGVWLTFERRAANALRRLPTTIKWSSVGHRLLGGSAVIGSWGDRPPAVCMELPGGRSQTPPPPPEGTENHSTNAASSGRRCQAPLRPSGPRWWCPRCERCCCCCRCRCRCTSGPLRRGLFLGSGVRPQGSREWVGRQNWNCYRLSCAGQATASGPRGGGGLGPS